MVAKRKFFNTDGSPRGIEWCWYRGRNTVYLTSKTEMAKGDSAIEKFVLSGLLPLEPFITKQHRVLTFGSCFAEGIEHMLRKWGYNCDPLGEREDGRHWTYVTHHSSSIVSSATLLQQFQWAYEGRDFSRDLWGHIPGHLSSTPDDVLAKETRDLFNNTDVFIVTLGLSEIWYDKESNDIFWRARSKDVFDPNKHGFRVASMSETKENLNQMIDIIRKYRPNATIIYSLSPVRLNATFRPISCMVANSASKAILRAALDEVLREREDDDNLFYWPSYEIVNDVYLDSFNEDNRHPKFSVQTIIMELFRKHYLVP